MAPRPRRNGEKGNELIAFVFVLFRYPLFSAMDRPREVGGWRGHVSGGWLEGEEGVVMLPAEGLRGPGRRGRKM